MIRVPEDRPLMAMPMAITAKNTKNSVTYFLTIALAPVTASIATTRTATIDSMSGRRATLSSIRSSLRAK